MVPRPGTTSPEDGMRIKQEPEAGVPVIEGSSPAYELATRPVAPQTSEGTSAAGREASDVGREADDYEAFEEKFAVPDAVPSKIATGLGASRGPPGPPSSSQSSKSSPTSKKRTSKKKKKAAKRKLRAVKKELKAPDSDEDGAEKVKKPLGPLALSADEMNYVFARQELARMLERDPVLLAIHAYRDGDLQGPITDPHLDEALTTLDVLRKLFILLGEAGIEADEYDVDELSALDVEIVMHTARKFVKVATDLVGFVPDVVTPPPTPRSPARAPHSAGTGSSRYLSPSAEIDSDSSDENKTRHMPLSASAPAFKLETKAIKVEPAAEIPSAPMISTAPAVPLELFKRALEAFARSTTNAAPIASAEPPATHLGVAPVATVGPTVPRCSQRKADSDESMRSARSEAGQGDGRHSAYPADDPDDLLEFGGMGGFTSRAAAVATNATGTTMTRIRMSATSDLKSFSGREAGEEKSRAWLNKLQSAANRDGMAPAEMCLLFNDLITGAARQWFLQLSRDVRSTWSDLSTEFQYQYCGKGVSVARKYYHATKRSEETPLEYLHRLNVAGIRAKLAVKDGRPNERREHVEHFIETLGLHDQELADQLTLLRLADAEELELVLRARQRSRDRQKNVVYSPNKFRTKPANPPPTQPKAVKVAKAAKPPRVESSSESEGDEVARAYCDAQEAEDRAKLYVAEPLKGENDGQSDQHVRPPCTHCGRTLHKSEDCWRIKTCAHCGGHHPSDKCFHLCKACGNKHDSGQCPMEEFFNQMRQWFVPQHHAGLLPTEVEKMLN